MYALLATIKLLQYYYFINNNRVANNVFGNFAKCLTYALPQACPSTGVCWVAVLFPFLSGVTETFWKIESKFLNSRVLAGGFVIGCAKRSWF